MQRKTKHKLLQDPLAQTRSLAQSGDAKAQFELAQSFAQAGDENSATTWYRKAAEQGLSGAQRILGFRLEQGIGCRVNIIEAVAFYERAAAQDDAEAQYNLAVHLEDGDGCSQNKKRAAELYRKAADKEIPEAQFNLGNMLLYGVTGVPQNPKEALRLIRLAAKEGLPQAQEELKKLHFQSTQIFAELEAEEKAKSNPIVSTKPAILQLEEEHKTIIPAVTSDPFISEEQKEILNREKMLELLFSDADLKKALISPTVEADFIKSIDSFFINTNSVPKDHNLEKLRKIFDKFKEAAIKNHAKAQFYVGLMLAKGVGCIKDEKEAVEWFGKAIENGYNVNGLDLSKPEITIRKVIKINEWNYESKFAYENKNEEVKNFLQEKEREVKADLEQKRITAEAINHALSIQENVKKPGFWNAMFKGFLGGNGLQVYQKLQDTKSKGTVFGDGGHRAIWRLLEWHIGELDRQYKYGPELNILAEQERKVKLQAWFILKEINPGQRLVPQTIFPIAAKLGIPPSPSLCECVEDLFVKQMEIFMAPDTSSPKPSEENEREKVSFKMSI